MNQQAMHIALDRSSIGYPQAVCLSANGEYVALASSRGETIVWSTELGEELCRFLFEPKKEVSSLEVSDDGKSLSYCYEGGFAFFDVQARILTSEIYIKPIKERVLCLSKGGGFGAYTDGSRKVIWTDLANGKPVMYNTEYAVDSLCVSVDGRSILLGYSQGDVGYLDVKSGRMDTLQKDGDVLSEIYAIPSGVGEYVLVGEDGQIEVRESVGGRLLRSISVDNLNSIDSLSCVEGEFIVAQHQGAFSVWNLASGEFLGTMPEGQLLLPGFSEKKDDEFCVCSSKESKDKVYLVACSRLRGRCWDVTQNRLASQWGGFVPQITRYLTVSSDGMTAIQIKVTSKEIVPLPEYALFEVSIWDVESKQLKRKLRIQLQTNGTVKSLSVSDTGQRIVFNCGYHSIYVLDLDGAIRCRKLSQNSRQMHYADLSANGDIVAIASLSELLIQFLNP